VTSTLVGCLGVQPRKVRIGLAENLHDWGICLTKEEKDGTTKSENIFVSTLPHS
jgi:hypothetical protein